MNSEEIKIRRIVPNIYSENLEACKWFYLNFLKMDLIMDLRWILTFASKENRTDQINIMETTEKEKADNKWIFVSIEVSDVDEMFERAKKMNCNISYELTNEPWGVRRFFVQDPNGATINLLGHISYSG